MAWVMWHKNKGKMIFPSSVIHFCYVSNKQLSSSKYSYHCVTHTVIVPKEKEDMAIENFYLFTSFLGYFEESTAAGLTSTV